MVLAAFLMLSSGGLLIDTPPATRHARLIESMEGIAGGSAKEPRLDSTVDQWATGVTLRHKIVWPAVLLTVAGGVGTVASVGLIVLHVVGIVTFAPALAPLIVILGAWNLAHFIAGVGELSNRLAHNARVDARQRHLAAPASSGLTLAVF